MKPLPVLGGTFLGINCAAPPPKWRNYHQHRERGEFGWRLWNARLHRSEIRRRWLTKSVPLELAEHGIRVNAVCVGAVATAIDTSVAGEITTELNERTPDIVEPWLAEILPLGRSGFPVDIANAALWLVEQRVEPGN